MGTILAAAGIFVGTDIDDLIVLTVLFLAARAAHRPVWKIWAGQYLGIAVLVGVSLLAALGLTLVPDRYVPLLGLVPLGLGIWGLIRAFRGGEEDEPPIGAQGILPVAGITIANGADNIAVYTPIFRTMSGADIAVLLVVFALLTAGWCALASWLGSHKRVIAVVERYGHWLVPLVFIGIGLVILTGAL
ncbi:cadmium resistance transporter [Paractinoplanes globisporus]|uniref:Cadmium resistance transporter n=1 Tax=Paractinoplanes globisporus TaxID=113565 RepID=A0ABW6WIU5_9ACTN|nr:cadmium resistance transporter [Actinoplanes globisporus]